MRFTSCVPRYPSMHNRASGNDCCDAAGMPVILAVSCLSPKASWRALRCTIIDECLTLWYCDYFPTQSVSSAPRRSNEPRPKGLLHETRSASSLPWAPCRLVRLKDRNALQSVPGDEQSLKYRLVLYMKPTCLSILQARPRLQFRCQVWECAVMCCHSSSRGA